MDFKKTKVIEEFREFYGDKCADEVEDYLNSLPIPLSVYLNEF